MTRKLILVVAIILSITIFFYPKERWFGCGAICINEEAVARSNEKKKNTICIGFEERISANDASGKRCYGIFIEK